MICLEVESCVIFTSFCHQGNPLQAGTEAPQWNSTGGVSSVTPAVPLFWALSWGSIPMDTQLERLNSLKDFLNKPGQWNNLSPVLLMVTWGLSQLWWEDTLGFSLWCPFPHQPVSFCLLAISVVSVHPSLLFCLQQQEMVLFISAKYLLGTHVD